MVIVVPAAGARRAWCVSCCAWGALRGAQAVGCRVDASAAAGPREERCSACSALPQPQVVLTRSYPGPLAGLLLDEAPRAPLRRVRRCHAALRALLLQPPRRAAQLPVGSLSGPAASYVGYSRKNAAHRGSPLAPATCASVSWRSPVQLDHRTSHKCFKENIRLLETV
jgi:hypothetical protein